MKKRIAVFFDAENIPNWINSNECANLIADLIRQGTVVIRKAYGKWDEPSLSKIQSPLHQMGFDMIHTYHSVSKKNSTDITIAIDAMESVQNNLVDVVVLATGDSDFSPVFRKLREKGIEVIGVGPESPLSDCVASSCSNFIYTSHRNVLRLSSSNYEPTDDSTKFDADAFALLEKALNMVHQPILLTALKLKMLAIDPKFSEKSYGYRNFTEYLTTSMMVNIEPTEKGLKTAEKVA